MESSRTEAFPVGLRVLVVDDDPTWLKILEKMLRKCSYEVTTCGLARVALDLLRERKDKFDIVISDVNMPDMDGFKLLEHVGLEMDLPVIMMSVDGETSRVMKGVQHGACDYLLKPIRMKELRNIWQHVYRKKIHEVRDIESSDISEDMLFLRNGLEDFEDRQIFGGGDVNSQRKRKDMDSKDSADQDLSDSAAVKKARVVWSVDLHQKFVNAVNQIGFDKVGPKKILDLMNVPGLTRENVASHLQKYRLYLSRLQKQNEGRTYGGNIQSDFSPKDPQTNIGLQNSIPVHQNNSSSRCLRQTTQTAQAHGTIPDMHVDDLKSTVSLHLKDRKEAVVADVPDIRKPNATTQLDVVFSFKGMKQNVDYKSVASPMSKQQPWTGGIPVMQFMQYPKHDHEPYSLLEDYSRLPQNHLEHEIGSIHGKTPPSVISITCTAEDKVVLSKPVFPDCRSCNTKVVSPVACTIDSVSVQVERGVVNSQDSGVTCETNGPSNCGWIPPSHELSIKNGADLVSLPEDLHLHSLQGIGCFENVGLNSMEIFQYNDSTSVTDFRSNWFDGIEYNCDYLYDSLEYPIIDECLFA